MRHGPVTTVLAATLILVAAGCTTSGSGDARPLASSPNPIRDVPRPARTAWPYWPVSMRIHPLTRVVTDAAGDTLIEARIEMQDRDGHTTRACGLLRLDLYDVSDESPGGSHAQWNLDLRDLAVNRERFDDVTLTYLFRLEVAPEQLPSDPVLWAYFLADDGQELSARLEVELPERSAF